MATTREHMISLLVEDTADTCREDGGYLFSLVREYWESMDDVQIAGAFRNLSSDRHDELPVDQSGNMPDGDGEPFESIELRFVPQAWINDQAVTVDHEEPDTWPVPLTFLLEEFPTEEDWNKDASRRDELRFTGMAPRWVVAWQGPFEVELAPGQDSPWDRKPDTVETRAHDVHVYATIRVKVHVLAPDHRQAMEKADELLFGQGFGVLLIPNAKAVVDAEYAEEVTAYLVDEADDPGHLGSRNYGANHEPTVTRS